MKTLPFTLVGPINTSRITNTNTNTNTAGVVDLKSMKELPDLYTWTPYGDPNPIASDGCEAIPVIDLDNPNAQQSIGVACKTWGVFQVTNHGINKKLLDKIENACKNLFELPSEQKMKAARPSNGITGYGPARISSFFQKKMWSEGFTISGSPIDHARKLWPNEYMTFCDTIEEYQKEMKELAKKLTHLILESLDISIEDIKLSEDSNNNNNGNSSNVFEGANGVIQLNSYPICPDPNRAMGLPSHTDSTLFTILYQNNTRGLQVYREKSGWVTVQPLENGLVINIGDLMQILSNGLYPSVYHRAMVNKIRHRYSIAYLYGPPPEARIQPIPKLIDATHPALYRPVTWTEYLGLKGKHFRKALSLVRLNNYGINTQKIVDQPKNIIKVDSESKVLTAIG